jgi:DNA polymerase-3 subunit beta
MKIQIAREILAQELFKVQGVTNQKTPMLILNHVLLEAKDDQLTIHATDLDVSISTTCPCQVNVPGSVTLQARRLYDMVKNLRQDDLVLDVEDNYFATLSAGSVNCRIAGTPASEFPEIQTNKEIDYIQFSTTRFLDMIEKTLFSVSTDETRPTLTGAVFRASAETGTTMISTDGHRLSRIHFSPTEEDPKFPANLARGLIVPRRGLVELKRMLDVADPELQLGFHGNNIVFKHGPATISVRLIDGKFPDVDQILPKESDNKARIRKSDLVHTLKFVAILAPHKTGNIRISFEEGQCEIHTQNPDHGEATEVIPVEYSGPPVKAGYNYRYMLDVLSAIDGDEISMEIIDTLSPTMIRDGSRDEVLYVVMPMRI